jgi:hypothetical protein
VLFDGGDQLPCGRDHRNDGKPSLVGLFATRSQKAQRGSHEQIDLPEQRWWVNKPRCG